MFKSNVDKFLSQNEEQIKKGLEDIGKMLVPEIRSETPVRTGHLRDSNDYDLTDSKTLIVYNNADYAEFVELGTIFMNANPFMRRAIYKNVDRMYSILKDNLKG